MANPAEKYQDEIRKIFDDFLDLMLHSTACVEVESTHCHGFCQIKLRLWKCSFCNHTLFTTFFTVRDESDLKHLAHYLDLIQRMWIYYTTTDDESDKD